MKQLFLEILTNTPIANDVFEMTLRGADHGISAPGQFINIKLDGFYLRRPISVCDYDENGLTIIYKVVGGGTEALSKMTTGEKIDVLSGLGNGFDTTQSTDSPLIIGGGVGVPPMYGLCKALAQKGVKSKVILGFNSKCDLFYEDKFKELGADVYVATADGSYGTKGFVTDIMKDLDYKFFYTCGPEPMFKAIDKIAKSEGQYSFEERMGCGFGACMGCSCKTLTGYKRICKEGPVMQRSEIIWKD